MIDFNKKHYLMLKRINHNDKIKCDSLSEDELSICHFLKDNNFIEEKYGIDDLGFDNHVLPIINVDAYTITEKGKAQIYTFRTDYYLKRLPIVISILALLTSIGSLIVSIYAFNNTNCEINNAIAEIANETTLNQISIFG